MKNKQQQQQEPSLRLKTWFNWTSEERSHAIYNAYSKRILKSNEIRSFLLANRLNNVSTYAFPLIAYPILSLTLFRVAQVRAIYFKYRSNVWNSFRLGTVGASWVWWLNYNPAYNHLNQQREKLLDLIYDKLGDQLTELNDALPRWTTAQEYNRRTQLLYNQRNGWFTGILYPQEQYSSPLVDMSSFPSGFVPDKITK